MCITITKKWRGNYDLICKKKYHDEASTIATHLSAYSYEAYDNPILSTFSPEFQCQAKLYTWVNGEPLFLEEKLLGDDNTKQFDFVISLKEEPVAKKRVRVYEED